MSCAKLLPGAYTIIVWVMSMVSPSHGQGVEWKFSLYKEKSLDTSDKAACLPLCHLTAFVKLVTAAIQCFFVGFFET